MKVDLRRVDEDISEVSIPVGDTILGRGPLLQCKDVKVSRHHALLHVSEDGKISLKSIHQNPCYLLHGRDIEKVLKEGDSQELKPGTRFSMLPNSFIYDVIVRDENSPTLPLDDLDGDGETTEVRVNLPLVECSPLKRKDDHENTNTGPATTKEVVSAEPSTSKAAGMITDIGKQGERWIASTDKGKVIPSGLNTNKLRQLPDWCKELGGSKKSEESLVASPRKGGPVKRSKPLTVTGNTKKRKKIKEDISDEEEEEKGNALREEELNCVKQSRPKAAGEDVKRRKKIKEDIDEEEDGTAPKEEPIASSSKPKREPCIFGSKCYRKNPVHREEFSHPGDSDHLSEEQKDSQEEGVEDSNDNEGDDERPECEFGTLCYRKNPLHAKQYKHTHTPNPPRQAKKKGGFCSRAYMPKKFEGCFYSNSIMYDLQVCLDSMPFNSSTTFNNISLALQ
ncbi:unnamed protein product [Darwinula stevensoni]|uniref:Aprataxin and PNK-like factor n=1 Tax=Darwinula stevensoni TaxID=69355 RepID=A0A7R8WXU4_9CRUS|nr:unnamed protein product [Darwinula stevensoni]CAG0878643.1 unnamed protein product [Darwinula stevensoni]